MPSMMTFTENKNKRQERKKLLSYETLNSRSDADSTDINR